MQIFYSDEFLKSVKKLSKRYKSIKNDLKKFIKELEEKPNLGIEIQPNIFKARIKNSDINKGKSAGYRIIIYLISRDEILLVNIYSKSDLANIPEQEIDKIISQYFKNI